MADQAPAGQHKIPAFVDFEIQVEAKGGQYEEYSVSVSSPSGEAHEIMKFPFIPSKLESQLKDIQIALLRSATPGRIALSEEAKAVQEFGRLMFNALITGEVRNAYAASQILAREQNKGLRMKLRISPPELAVLPWEFLFDSRQAEYVCLSRNTPLVRYIDVPLPAEPAYSKLPLRVLGMVASPADQTPLKVAAEKKRVSDALAALIQSGQVELKWLDGGTWQDLYNAMGEGPWHVFHFIGHGGYDRMNDEGTILLEDPSGSTDHMRATQLARLLADHPSMRLVVLNSCEGARGGREDLFSSTASILVRRGISAVLAMQYEISDAAAIAFSTHFYKALAEGWPVDAAVTAVRISMSLLMDYSLEWATPVLYMRSRDGVLFNIDPASRPAVKPAAAAPPPPAVPDAVEIPARSSSELPAIEKAPPQVKQSTPATQSPRAQAKPLPRPILWGGAGFLLLAACICLVLVGPGILNIINPPPVAAVATDTSAPATLIAPPLPIMTPSEAAPPTDETPGPTSQPSIKTPVDVLTEYWKDFGDANYSIAWTSLSAGYKDRNYQGDVNKYIANQAKKYCSVALTEPRVLTTTPKTVFVLGRVIYQMQPGCEEAPNLLVHEMTLENGTWKIDRAHLGVRSDSKCTSAPRRLSAGIQARVVTQIDAVILRAFPAPPEGQYSYGRLEPTTVVDVLEGPICGEFNGGTWWWWKVRPPAGVEGWVVESGDTEDPVWIEPVR